MSGETKTLIASAVRTRIRLMDYIELMKPELTFLSVLTALCGFYLASEGAFAIFGFVHTALGTALVGGGAGALNQYIERSYDALMKRTERRPLPAGRIAPTEALIFGIVVAVAGLTELMLFVNLLTSFLAFLTITSYLFLYTPLKRVTPSATLVGGIPGALPPLMGWAAARNELAGEAWILFAILFLWQMPHFLSLAWMYRKDYARAGFKMLTVVDKKGNRTARQIVLFCAALLPASLMSTFAGMTGSPYLVGALALGFAFLAIAILFAWYTKYDADESLAKANFYSRKIFFVSLLYLPALMFLMTIDKL